LSGLSKIITEVEGKEQEKWRPKSVHHYIQDYYMKPDFVIDISAQVDKKLEAILAFKTQFYNPDSTEPKTPISGEDFIDFLKGRWADYGRYIGVPYAEGFVSTRPIGVDSLTEID
jgi:LmbE family N-acetylglucosaminyl deacetylase